MPAPNHAQRALAAVEGHIKALKSACKHHEECGALVELLEASQNVLLCWAQQADSLHNARVKAAGQLLRFALAKVARVCKACSMEQLQESDSAAPAAAPAAPAAAALDVPAEAASAAADIQLAVSALATALQHHHSQSGQSTSAAARVLLGQQQRLSTAAHRTGMLAEAVRRSSENGTAGSAQQAGNNTSPFGRAASASAPGTVLECGRRPAAKSSRLDSSSSGSKAGSAQRSRTSSSSGGGGSSGPKGTPQARRSSGPVRQIAHRQSTSSSSRSTSRSCSGGGGGGGCIVPAVEEAAAAIDAAAAGPFEAVMSVHAALRPGSKWRLAAEGGGFVCDEDDAEAGAKTHAGGAQAAEATAMAGAEAAAADSAASGGGQPDGPLAAVCSAELCTSKECRRLLSSSSSGSRGSFSSSRSGRQVGVPADAAGSAATDQPEAADCQQQQGALAPEDSSSSSSDSSGYFQESYALLQNGNAAYTAGRYAAAAKLYQTAVDSLGVAAPPQASSACGARGAGADASPTEAAEGLLMWLKCCLNLACCDFRQGLYRASVAQCDSVLEVDPGNAVALCHRGRALLKMQQHAAARADLSAALELLVDGGTQRTTAHHIALNGSYWEPRIRGLLASLPAA